MNEGERINKWKKEQRVNNPEYRKKETERVKDWRKKNPDKVREMAKRSRAKRSQNTEAYRSKCWLDSFLQNDIAECLAFYNDDCI